MEKKALCITLSCLIILLSCLCGCFGKQAADSSDPSAATSESAPAPATRDTPREAGWFDDAVFVGDSVTLKLSYYCEENPQALGNAQFFCAGSLGYTSALWDMDDPNQVHPYYQGQIYLTQDCAKETGAKKVFIMLGMNDIALVGVDEAVNNAKTLATNILKESPDVSIHLQSVTPMMKGKDLGDLNIENIQAFNKRLEELCAAQGWQYLDIYHVVADDEGYLPAEYCGDEDAQGLHFTDAACDLWVKYLKENAR